MFICIVHRLFGICELEWYPGMVPVLASQNDTLSVNKSLAFGVAAHGFMNSICFVCYRGDGVFMEACLCAGC